MKFFTDKTVKNDYLLVKIKDYLKMKDFSRWKEVLIDPGVYDLKKGYKFSWEDKINIPEFLDSLPDNHYFSLDLPSDMNLKYKKYFLEKSWQYAQAYSYHPKFIVTVQFYYNNYWNFIECFDKYNNLEIKSCIIGLGNMCKTGRKPIFMKHALDYAYSHCTHPKIHIYGLPIRYIKYTDKLSKTFNIKTSIDSTKWTFMWYEVEKTDQNNRQLLFDLYLEKIRKKGVILENEI